MAKNLNSSLVKGFRIEDNHELDLLLDEITRRLNELSGSIDVLKKTNVRDYFVKPAAVTPGAGANPNPGQQQAMTDNMGNLVFNSTFNPIVTNGV